MKIMIEYFIVSYNPPYFWYDELDNANIFS